MFVSLDVSERATLRGRVRKVSKKYSTYVSKYPYMLCTYVRLCTGIWPFPACLHPFLISSIYLFTKIQNTIHQLAQIEMDYRTRTTKRRREAARERIFFWSIIESYGETDLLTNGGILLTILCQLRLLLLCCGGGHTINVTATAFILLRGNKYV